MKLSKLNWSFHLISSKVEHQLHCRQNPLTYNNKFCNFTNLGIRTIFWQKLVACLQNKKKVSFRKFRKQETFVTYTRITVLKLWPHDLFDPCNKCSRTFSYLPFNLIDQPLKHTGDYLIQQDCRVMISKHLRFVCAYGFGPWYWYLARYVLVICDLTSSNDNFDDIYPLLNAYKEVTSNLSGCILRNDSLY